MAWGCCYAQLHPRPSGEEAAITAGCVKLGGGCACSFSRPSM
jgi:hypothetical protein